MSKACKQCHLLTEEVTCPNCGGQTSKNWSGVLQIMDPEKSELAKTMNISKAGTYALKVR